MPDDTPTHTRSHVVSARLPESLVKRIDRLRQAHLTGAGALASVTRNAMLVALVEAGLDAIERGTTSGRAAATADNWLPFLDNPPTK